MLVTDDLLLVKSIVEITMVNIILLYCAILKVRESDNLLGVRARQYGQISCVPV